MIAIMEKMLVLCAQVSLSTESCVIIGMAYVRYVLQKLIDTKVSKSEAFHSMGGIIVAH